MHLSVNVVTVFELLLIARAYIVPVILMGPLDMTLEYRDLLTATFTCTAFGGDHAQLLITWTFPSSDTGYNTSSRIEIHNSDNSTTSRITTLPLSLSDRGSQSTCDVAYASGPTAEVEASATLNIGEYYAIVTYLHTIYTVEPPIKDTPNKGNLSIKDKSTCPNSYYTSTF